MICELLKYINDCAGLIVVATTVVSSFLSDHSGPISILLTIIGWFAVFYFNIRQQEKQIQLNAKMKVYEELCNLKKEVDDKGRDLNFLLNPFSAPFLEMEYADRSIKQKQINLKALEIWGKYLEKLSKGTFSFVRAYLELWVHFKRWICIMPDLKKMYKELFEVQFTQLTDNLYDYHKYLQSIQIKNFYWETWDKEEIKKRSKKIQDEFDQIAVGYLDDFMIEINNSLLSPIFKSKSVLREDFKNLPERYKILTKDGIQEIS
ncbi:MAG: hypothetical protein M0R20_04500 [Candidatus Omnitrophica bacterium]|jgi:hypothetical protein|nr:hypothetical protein [Candidatus Omnitrophota bacterium]